jgi:hypothetical protein
MTPRPRTAARSSALPGAPTSGVPADLPVSRSTGTGQRSSLALRLAVAVALLVSAAVHVDLASSPLYAAGQLTLSALFLAQAVTAALVAGWVLVRPRRAAFAVAALVGLGSLLALVLSVYVRVPSFGPFPVLYEPYWYGPKVVAAVAAAVAAAAGLAAVVIHRTATPGRSAR